MHVTKLAEARPERGAGWSTQPLTDLSWLLDAELGESEHGALARMTIEAAESRSHTATRGPRRSRSSSTAAGRRSPAAAGCRSRPATSYAPAGAAHALRAGAEGLDLLVVLSATSAAAAGWEAGEASAAEAPGEARLLSGPRTDRTAAPARPSSAAAASPPTAAPTSCIATRAAPGSSSSSPAQGRAPRPDGGEVAVEPGDAALLPPGPATASATPGRARRGRSSASSASPASTMPVRSPPSRPERVPGTSLAAMPDAAVFHWTASEGDG